MNDDLESLIVYSEREDFDESYVLQSDFYPSSYHQCLKVMH